MSFVLHVHTKERAWVHKPSRTYAHIKKTNNNNKNRLALAENHISLCSHTRTHIPHLHIYRHMHIRWSKSRRISMRCRIPRIHSTMLSKKKKGCRLARGKSWMGQ